MQITDADLQLIRDRLIARFPPAVLQEWAQEGWRINKAFRRRLAEVDIEFFLRFYLPHHFSREPATYHRETYRVIEEDLSRPGRDNEVFCWPRAGGKTTTLVLGVPLWCVCLEKRHCIVLVADSHDQAKMHLGALKAELEENERLQEDFGDLRGPRWQEDDIVTSNGVQLLALGHGMKLRGRKYRQYRPDLILVDDPEDLEAAASPTQSTNLWNWFMRTLLPSGWVDTKTFVIGNIIHWNCLVARLLKSAAFRGHVYRAVESFAEREDLWGQWEAIATDLSLPPEERRDRAYAFYKANEAEMLRGAKVSWPAGTSYYEQMVTRATIRPDAYATEYQNDPADPTMKFFKRYHTYRRELRADGEWLVPTSGQSAVRLADCALFARTDPSMGEAGGSDPSAIVIIARARDGRKFVLEADIRRRPPDVIIADQERFFERYPVVRWQIEQTQFQAFFAQEAIKRQAERGLRIPYKPVDSIKNKILRIQSLQPAIENGEILFNEQGQEHIKMELDYWQPFKENQPDDGLDALEGACREADAWGQMLSDAGTTVAETHQFGTQVFPQAFDPAYDTLEDELELAGKFVLVRQPDGTERRYPLCVPRIAAC